MKLISLLLLLFLLIGCTNYANSKHFVEIADGNGLYINSERPTFVITNFIDSQELAIPLVVDERIFGEWVVNIGYGDMIFTVSEDNYILYDNNVVARWYWFLPDVMLIESDIEQSLLHFQFDDGNPYLVLFTELSQDGNYYSWLGVKQQLEPW